MSRSNSATSEALFDTAQTLMPGGVSSPVRAFRHIGGAPVYMQKGEGAWLTDVDGNRYVDYCMAWGPNILGHAHPAVVEAVTRTAREGLAFGTPHRNEVKLAELVLEAYAPFDRVRFVVSGTEAVLTATRLARAATGRKLLVKFEGCYHGHVDALLAKAGSGLVTQGLSESEGVAGAVHDTVVVPLGDTAALTQLFAERGAQIAAVITEPLPANNGLLVQTGEWLKSLRTLCDAHGSLLIFDEVISGFRFGFHGFGKLHGVTPDLVTLGKILGGGLPVGGITGRAALLDRLAPVGKVYQAGTMAGNPVALASGLATLTELKTGAPYQALAQLSEALGAKLSKHKAREVVQLKQVGSLFWPYFAAGPVPTTMAAVSPAATARYTQAYRQWLAHGVYLPPSAWEVSFLSTAHTPANLDTLLDALALPVTAPHA